KLFEFPPKASVVFVFSISERRIIPAINLKDDKVQAAYLNA
ncbi:unnamed protein product, partial [Heterotrigona itama]